MKLKCVYVCLFLMFCSCEATKNVTVVLKHLAAPAPKLKLLTPDKEEAVLKSTQEKGNKQNLNTSVKSNDNNTTVTQQEPSHHDQVTERKNDTLCMENLGTCQVKLHEHKLKNGACPSDHALLTGLCSDEKQSCCVPSQKVRDTWNVTDQRCLEDFGTCKNSKTCDGNSDADKCGGPMFRSCCIPEWNDTKCSYSYGECQASSNDCEGKYNTSLCDGPSSRSCCLPSDEKKEEWKVIDKKCESGPVYGQCQPVAQHCAGEKKAELCGGGDSRICCKPSDGIKSNWTTEEDPKCNQLWGTCQKEEDQCSSGSSKSNLCGGPSTRTCCIPDSETIKSWSTKCSQKFGKCVMKLDGTCNSTEQFACGESKHHVCCVPTLKTKFSWDDSSCLKVKGKCQHTSTPCQKGQYDRLQLHPCGGPADRLCCVPEDHIHNDVACTSQGGKCQEKSESCSDGHKFDSSYKCREHPTRLCCLKKITKTIPVSHNNNNSKEKVNHATTHSGGQVKATILVPTILFGLVIVMGILYAARKRLCYSGSYSYLRVKDKVSYETRGLLTSRPDSNGKKDLHVQLSV